MGNCCIVPLQAKAKAKAIRVMKTDGKILEYKPPIKVYQVLSEFKSHAISDSLPEPAKKKKVKFADQLEEEEEEVGQQVRIKLIISKQELKSMLSREGISLSDIVCHLKNEGRYWTTDQINRSDNVDDDDDDEDVFSALKDGSQCRLDSIPEI